MANVRAGSLPWCLGLAYVGQKLGEKWDKDPMLKTLFHRFDFVIGIALAVLVALVLPFGLGAFHPDRRDQWPAERPVAPQQVAQA